jgi:hypothetical protein
MVRKLLLVCGILSSLLYAAMNVIGRQRRLTRGGKKRGSSRSGKPGFDVSELFIFRWRCALW